MADFEVHGADQFLMLSKALKYAGRTDMRKKLHRGIAKAAKPLIPKARAEARRRLPQSGGLAAQVAKEPMRAQVRTGNDPGVRIVVGRKRGGARSANRGVVRHPVFGRDVWVDQAVRPGWFDESLMAEKRPIQRDVEVALQEVADEIARGVR